MEIAFSEAQDLEVLQGAGEGEEIPGVIAISAYRIRLQVHHPLLSHEGLQSVSFREDCHAAFLHTPRYTTLPFVGS